MRVHGWCVNRKCWWSINVQMAHQNVPLNEQIHINPGQLHGTMQEPLKTGNQLVQKRLHTFSVYHAWYIEVPFSNIECCVKVLQGIVLLQDTAEMLTTLQAIKQD